MRVLMTADTLGGVWTYAMELCRALDKHGVEILLATMGRLPNSAQRIEASQIRNLTIRESGFKLEWMEDPWGDVDAAGDWLLALERQFGPDIVHLNGYAHASMDWRAPTVVVCHSCVLSWWIAVKGEAPPKEIWGEYRGRVSAGLRAAAQIAAPTEDILRSVQQLYRCDGVPAAVIPNGRDPSQFIDGAKHPYIFSAGRVWDEAKNLESLDRIASELSWPVYLAGDTNHPAHHAKRQRLNSARLLGKLSSREMSCWLSSAAIYCLPARYEPFGLSILEAALSGCALVLGDIPSLRELWQGAAIFVPNDDDVVLLSAVQELIVNKRRRTQFAQLARERARVFSADRMAAQYFHLYQELLSTSSVPTHKEARACAS